jgi:hypothetical protein
MEIGRQASRGEKRFFQIGERRIRYFDKQSESRSLSTRWYENDELQQVPEAIDHSLINPALAVRLHIIYRRSRGMPVYHRRAIAADREKDGLTIRSQPRCLPIHRSRAGPHVTAVDGAACASPDPKTLDMTKPNTPFTCPSVGCAGLYFYRPLKKGTKQVLDRLTSNGSVINP